MQRTRFDAMACPIARSLEHVGEWWTILILRDAFLGVTQFDQFQKSLGIASNMLTRRLNALVAAGLLERRRYQERPPRSEYVLTDRGRDFRPVLWSLLAFGNRHFAHDGSSIVLVDRQTGQTADPVLVDRISGKVMTDEAFRAERVAPPPGGPPPADDDGGSNARHGLPPAMPPRSGDALRRPARAVRPVFQGD